MRLCVFCGSSDGARPLYREAATALGRHFAQDGIELVYGGGKVGLMGAVADGALAAGGRVTGIMPKALVEKETAHLGLTDLRVVASMHERKALMADLADGFVALPGGLGTFEEMFEVWTWAQLGYHRKPLAVFNAGGFFDGLLSFLDSVVAEGFVREPHRAMLIVGTEPADLVARIRAYEPPRVIKWVKSEER
ncbi:TIGR00730 family Rossman fold protein [Methylobacterium frigidaeris]|uniref:Cytokinin riboside 5'-monophosphate phosphoribohydrolase n=1 Tax=Methylobacterium frigidaeris TaxID=2038277 RepID=A0AA37M6N3_9HYPH|nr:TIGR00730 family Rossman fold protein [Methylobacterium frigidaeris]PIK70857.1 TIGR00730 family Rossman fold protein [Methylobacterium frigidaeris]GJD65048.1 Putative cytokinin riboside 5'-monophosphate phosphoribohydrolase [Methylobacterium frigidaeris]